MPAGNINTVFASAMKLARITIMLLGLDSERQNTTKLHYCSIVSTDFRSSQVNAATSYLLNFITTTLQQYLYFLLYKR